MPVDCSCVEGLIADISAINQLIIHFLKLKSPKNRVSKSLRHLL